MICSYSDLDNNILIISHVTFKNIILLYLTVANTRLSVIEFKDLMTSKAANMLCHQKKIIIMSLSFSRYLEK